MTPPFTIEVVGKGRIAVGTARLGTGAVTVLPEELALPFPVDDELVCVPLLEVGSGVAAKLALISPGRIRSSIVLSAGLYATLVKMPL